MIKFWFSFSDFSKTLFFYIVLNIDCNNPIFFIEKPETIPGAANTMLRGSIKLAKGKSKPLLKMSKDKTSEHDILQRWFFIK